LRKYIYTLLKKQNLSLPAPSLIVALPTNTNRTDTNKLKTTITTKISVKKIFDCRGMQESVLEVGAYQLK
jgi:hypothetical protein